MEIQNKIIFLQQKLNQRKLRKKYTTWIFITGQRSWRRFTAFRISRLRRIPGCSYSQEDDVSARPASSSRRRRTQIRFIFLWAEKPKPSWSRPSLNRYGTPSTCLSPLASTTSRISSNTFLR